MNHVNITRTVFLQVVLVTLCLTTSLGAGENKSSNKVHNREGTIAIPDQLLTPASNVRLTGGILKRVFDDNVRRLIQTYPLDDILFRFRQRAGNPNPPGRSRGWEHVPPLLYGSLAGMFLMGSGNALRWEEHAELRNLMNRVIDGIEQCKQPNDFIMAYAEKDTAKAENPNYVRAWLTHGLIEAHVAGNSKALPLIRGHQDWFNRCEYLPIVKDLHLGYQGMIANARMYFTSMGRKRDLEVLQQYYQEDWWLDQLIVNDDRAIYKRPAAHCYEITAFEAYLDLYRSTGTKRYLTAMLNAWDMIHDKWEHVGGSIAISWGEHINRDYPPHSHFIDWESPWTGELCGSVFWILLNQRLHRLYPDVEKYANEIEKSIYNIGVANQAGSEGIRYHALLNKQKDTILKGDMQVSCCEGQAVRLYGALPEYLYSIAPDGLYVDMYSDSEITWDQGGSTVTLKDSTSFPEDEAVKLSIVTENPVAFTLRLRMPSWLDSLVQIHIDGATVAEGTPGTYLPITRTWKNGDTVSFTLPMDFKVSRYEGFDKIEGYDQYAIEYGPVLLGVVGDFDFRDLRTRIVNDPAKPADWLVPVEGKPLHYSIKGKPGHEYLPYYEIQDQRYTCYPVIVSPDTDRVQQLMKLYPEPTLPGVDLTWHMDRALEYMNNSLDRSEDAAVQGMPFYGNYFWPARLTHSVWDAPHCVGRLLHASTIWEETFQRRNADEETTRLLRDLLHSCISEEDGLGHFHPACKETQEIDEHSQREVLLALVGLARVRQDQESLALAKKLVRGYAAWIESNPKAAGNYTWAGRFIHALLDYHRLTQDPLALTLAQNFVDKNQEANFDDKGTYRGGHNHSMLGTMANLIEFGLYTKQPRYVDRIRRIIDKGLWDVRTKFGLIAEMNKGVRGEANCTGDLIRAEILLGRHGYPEYFDDVERLVRNHLLASQFLDPTLANNEKTDTPEHRDAARRCCGGFAFSMPNGLVHTDNYERPEGELVLALDLVQGAMDALIKVWDAIATRDEKGIWVNLLFSKKMPDLEIRSFIPAEGRVSLKVKEPSDVYVRIPNYVALDDLHLSVDGVELPKRMFGRYILVPKQARESIVSLTFKQPLHTEEEVIGEDTYRVEWLGDTVLNIEPKGKFAPLYYPARLRLYGRTPDAKND